MRQSTSAAEPLETEIAAAWAQILGVASVERDDDFFASGGDSLLAVRAALELSRRLGVRVSMRAMFERPTVAELAQHLAGSGEATAQPVVADLPPSDGGAPLSYQQRGIWFLNALAPGNRAYHFQATLELDGHVDADRFRTAARAVFARQELLRTAFVAEHGVPHQVVLDAVEPVVDLVDLREFDDAEAERRYAELLRAACEAPFDLARPPLVRWVIARTRARDVVIHVEHHLVHDGWSVAVLLNDLLAAYDGRPPEPLQTSYAGYARRQHAELADPAWVGSRQDFWRRRLAGVPQVAQLPLDRPRPEVQSFGGATLRLSLEPGLTARLRARAKASRCTLFATMLAAFQVVVWRYTGERRFVVGTSLGCRTRPELEALVGMFVNVVPLVTEIDPAGTFRELQGNARDRLVEVLEHQELPFEKIVEALAPARDLGRNPLVQNTFSFHDAQIPELDFGGARGFLRERSNGSSKLDLNVVVIPRDHTVAELGGGLHILWEYNGALFERETMEAMLRAYVHVLKVVAQSGETSLGAIELADPAEVAAALEAVRRVAAPRAAGATLHARVAELARAAGSRPALDGPVRLSYADLDLRAEAVADELRAAGVGSGCTVGVLARRGPAFAVAALGVMKTGAAYVPCDPSDPDDRLAFVARDARLSAMVTDDPARAGTVVPNLRSITLASDGTPGATRYDGVAGDVARVVPDGSCYVIYTSGSSGQPKGAIGTHAGVLNALDGFDEIEPLQPAWRCSWTASPGFDASAFETFSALCFGGTLIPADEDARLHGAAFARWLGVSEIQAGYVPSFMLADLAAAASERRFSLRRIMVGVEPIDEALLVELRTRIPGLRIINAYGPTEASIFSTLYPVDGPPVERRTPIGRAIPNVRAEVVDDGGRPVPFGVVGELRLSGAGVGHGYLGRPELTARAFDLHAEPRAYRTGDLCRYRIDGNLVFVGRRDRQLKLRGYRIEPGEVEAALRADPAVREAAVEIEGEGAHAGLAAYIVPRDSNTWDERECRRRLINALPAQMIPARIVLLHDIPRTAAGKVDRRRLPAIPRATTRAQTVPVQSDEEAAMAELWRAVLECETVGRNDNFFALGGNSLSAAVVAARVRERFGVTLPIPAIFRAADLAALTADVVALPKHAAAAAEGPNLWFLR